MLSLSILIKETILHTFQNVTYFKACPGVGLISEVLLAEAACLCLYSQCPEHRSHLIVSTGTRPLKFAYSINIQSGRGVPLIFFSPQRCEMSHWGRMESTQYVLCIVVSVENCLFWNTMRRDTYCRWLFHHCLNVNSKIANEILFELLCWDTYCDSPCHHTEKLLNY
jgi:hypothetical protein